MKFYKVIKDFPISSWLCKNEAKIGDVLLKSFYFQGATKVATKDTKTVYGLYSVDIQQLLELGYVRPLMINELNKLTPHLKKEMILFDYPISIKENATLEDIKYIKEKVKRYIADKYRNKK